MYHILPQHGQTPAEIRHGRRQLQITEADAQQNCQPGHRQEIRPTGSRRQKRRGTRQEAAAQGGRRRQHRRRAHQPLRAAAAGSHSREGRAQGQEGGEAARAQEGAKRQAEDPDEEEPQGPAGDGRPHGAAAGEDQAELRPLSEHFTRRFFVITSPGPPLIPPTNR